MNTINSQIAITSILCQNPELAPQIDIDPVELVDGTGDTPRIKQVYSAVQDLIRLKITPEPSLVARNSNTSSVIVKKFFENKNFELDNLDVYLSEIRSETFRKEVKKLGLEIAELAEQEQVTDDQILFDIQQKASKVKPKGLDIIEGSNFGNIRKKYLAKVEEQKHLPLSELVLELPYTDYNHKFGGLFYGDYSIIAGNTGIGKTSMLGDIIEHTLTSGKNVLSFVLEMSDEQITQRQISKLSGLTMRELREVRFYGDHLKRASFFEAVDKISKFDDNWIIFDTEVNEITDIFSIAKRICALKKIHLITLDYIQLAKYKAFQNNRTLEVGFSSQLLAQLAKQTNSHVLAAAQPNRSPADRADKRLYLTDLKDSSLLEQSADNVLFIHRPGYYDPDCENPNIAELNQAKGRNVGTGLIKLLWKGATTSFHNLQSGDIKEVSIF